MKKLILFLILLSSCTVYEPRIPSKIAFQFDVTSTPRAPKKQVNTIDLPFVEQWKWNGKISSSEISPAKIMVVRNRIIVITFNRGDETATVFDAHSGDMIWQSRIINNIRSLHADDKRVYIGTIRYALAFDLETGQELWQGAKQKRDKKGRLHVYSKEKYVEVHDFGEDKLYLLDTETGETIEESIQPNLYFKRNDISYLLQGHCCLKAVDGKKRKTLWIREFEGGPYQWPVFTNDVMLINAWQQLFGLNATTGDIIWQTPADTQFITAMVLGGDVAYALRHDAAIVGFNPETGEQVGIIKTSPNRTWEDDGGYVTHYAIAASDRFVAAYYGNSQELFVFEKVDE